MLETASRSRQCVITVDAIGVASHDAVVSGVHDASDYHLQIESCFLMVVQCSDHLDDCCSLQWCGLLKEPNKQNCEAVYLYASAGEFDELEWRAETTRTTRFIYEGVTGDPIEGSVEIQPVGQNWRSDPQWSRAVAPGWGP